MNDLKIYSEVSGEMKTGDALLYVGSGSISKTIGWWTRHVLRSEADPSFTHGNLILRFEQYELMVPYSMFRQVAILEPKRRWVLDARASGVYPVFLKDYLANYDGSAYWYPLKDEFDGAREAIGRYALELAGKGYDYWGLFKNAVGLVSADLRRLFCTESMFLSWRDGGKIVSGDKAPRPDTVPALNIFKDPKKLF